MRRLELDSATQLVALDADHPGFRDPEYRARRDRIAAVALAHRPGSEVPEVEYTAAEHALWGEIRRRLAPLHEARICSALLDAQRRMPLGKERIPQLREINERLATLGGFRMEPVAGLIAPRRFLEALADRIFLATQYIRHVSRPLYTPEPDVVHELVGHAASLAHPAFADLSAAFGEAARRADDARLPLIERLYWYTLEYGLVYEGSELKAVGAGLLSSVGELERFASESEIRAFEPASVVETEYDPTDYQPTLFAAPSFDELVAATAGWLKG